MIWQVNNSSPLEDRIRYFGLQDNRLNGSLPAYLSDTVLPDLSRVNIALKV